MHTTLKIFGMEFEHPWRSGVRFFLTHSVFSIIFEAKKVLLCVIGHLGMRFNKAGTSSVGGLHGIHPGVIIKSVLLCTSEIVCITFPLSTFRTWIFSAQLHSTTS